MRFEPGTLNRQQADALNRILEAFEVDQQPTGVGGAELADGPNGPAFSTNFENVPKPLAVRLKNRPDNVIPPIAYSSWVEVSFDDAGNPLDFADALQGDSTFKAFSATGVEAPRNMESYPLAMLSASGETLDFWTYPIMRFIQILSLQQSPDGFYPAQEMTFDPVTLTWIPGEECWWRDANQ